MPHIDTETAEKWTDDDVIERWLQLFKGNMLVDRYRRGETKTQGERDAVADIAATWRSRLMEISWFMRCLNESIARDANKEDNCKGRFWEGRFKTQALLDETALLTCMMYVDLNPIRAGISHTLEESDSTSIQDRLIAFAKQKAQAGIAVNGRADKKEKNCELLPFKGGESLANDTVKGLSFSLQDYFELIDWTGRVVRKDNRGAIPAEILPILQKLGVNKSEWVENVNHFGRRFYTVVGSVEAMRNFSDRAGQGWVQGVGCSHRLYAKKGGL